MARTLSRRPQRRAPVDVEQDDGDYYADAADEYATDADEESSPRTRRSRSARSAPRSERRGRDEDDRPSRRKPRSSGGRSERSGGSVKRGREAFKRNQSRSSKFNDEDKLTVDVDETVLIHFVEDFDNFFTWAEHWVDEIKSGKKSFVCLLDEENGDDCPLCEIGYPVSERAAFNVVTFDKKGNPVLKYWILTPDPMGKLEKEADKRRNQPINREDLYWEVSKEKLKNQRFSYSVSPISADDMEHDYEIQPLDPEELEDLAEKLFGEDTIVHRDSYEKLVEIVESLDD